MNILFDNFDSSVFGKNVYRVSIDPLIDTIHELKNEIQKFNNVIFYCFIPVDSRYIDIVENLDFHLVSIRNTYVHRGIDFLHETKIIDSHPSCIVKEFTKETSISQDSIQSFANLIGQVNRYYKDEKIPKDQSQAIYVRWIENSLWNGLASKSFFIFFEDNPVGICTTRLSDDHMDARIDLFGILPQFRGRGFGKLLLFEAMKYLYANKPKRVWVATAGENIQANRFFQRNHFLLSNVELVYHKHV